MRSSFVQFRFDMRSRVDIGRYGTLVPSVPPKPRSAQAYTFTYMQWQALPCVPKPQQLPHTDSASQEAVEANADSQHTSNSHLDCGCVTLVAKETFEGKRQAM
nr:uncharacterized protein LOC126518584 [Dermacentor andersoni]XP_054926725.1 uncharacterized protein LOC129384987 isoform X2 [Dermacentor andersoni]